jgi:hypothetical protein
MLLFTSTYSSYSSISNRRILDVVKTENTSSGIILNATTELSRGKIVVKNVLDNQHCSKKPGPQVQPGVTGYGTDKGCYCILAQVKRTNSINGTRNIKKNHIIIRGWSCNFAYSWRNFVE